MVSDETWRYVEKAKMGLLMGGTTGLCVGFLAGGMTVLRYGPGERGYLATVGSQMLQTGGFLGLIMSIGMMIRNDSEESIALFKPQPRQMYWMNAQRKLPIIVEKLEK